MANKESLQNAPAPSSTCCSAPPDSYLCHLRHLWLFFSAPSVSSASSAVFLLRTICVICVICGFSLWAAAPRFYPDDPIWIDDDTALDASKALEQEDSNGYDFFMHTVLKPGDRRDVRAMNVNTLDEVPDSSWFTNRIGRQQLSTADIVRGPDRMPRISLDGWVLSGDKGAGVQPGWRMTDPSGQLYQIEVDPPGNPEMATGAEIIGTAFYHALGYHVVDVYLAELDPDKVIISPKATIRDPTKNFARRPFTQRDLRDILRRAARRPDGRYRVLASRFASGRPLGNFRYYGTRSDDPNDIVPHEHRRELRGARVFGAWLNHDDSRGVNSLDMLEEKDGRGRIKHYMFDFGSTLGSATVFAQRHRAGNEYIFENRPGWLALATLGFYIRPWMLIDYPDMPRAVGRFEGDSFDPAAWKPEYPNPAFDNMRPDDAFWAARIVSRFSNDIISAIVQKAEFTDPRATDYMTETLIKRRDKVLRTWLNGVNPIVDLALSPEGTLTFKNAAVDAGVATPPSEYSMQWFDYDNTTDQRKDLFEGGVGAGPRGGVETSRMPRIDGPRPASVPDGGYVGLTISAKHPDHPAWAKPATFYFRRAGSDWQWVGTER